MKDIVAVFIGIILMGIFFAFLLRLIRLAKLNDFSYWEERKILIKSLLIIFFVGGLFWAAGYVPVISFTSPAFIGDKTRHNLFAIAGGSLSLVAGLSCLLALIAKSIDRVRAMTIATVTPLIIVGLFYQLWSQNERFKAWDEQKRFWNLMSETIPGLIDDSEVVIIIPGYDQLQEFQFLPLVGNWEARNALKVLYNNPTLQGIYYYSDLPHEGTNILSSDLDWSKIVFVYYDPNKLSLEIVRHPEDMLLLSFRVIGYDPESRIGDRSIESQSYHFLVR